MILKYFALSDKMRWFWKNKSLMKGMREVKKTSKQDKSIFLSYFNHRNSLRAKKAVQGKKNLDIHQNIKFNLF